MTPRLQVRIRSALDEISRAFLDLRAASERPGLASGAAGLALLHHALDRVFPDRGHAARAEGMLGHAFESVKQDELSASLFSGFVGVAWVSDRLARSAAPEQDANGEVDELLVAALEEEWQGPYDLVDGLVGLGVYALERLPRAQARRLLVAVLTQLERRAEKSRTGLVWKSNPGWIPQQLRGTRTVEYVDWGLAHGVPGVIALLAKTAAANVERRRALGLLSRAVASLLAVPTAAPSSGCYPPWEIPGQSVEPARAAWCYGDLGLACALLLAGRAARQPAWSRRALLLARAVAVRHPAEAGVLDGGLCHGAAGHAHAFRRLFQATGDRAFDDASKTWLDRLLGMRRPGVGVAGYEAVHVAAGESLRVGEAGFLTGTAGIGLALADVVEPSIAGWDHVLLLPGDEASRMAA